MFKSPNPNHVKGNQMAQLTETPPRRKAQLILFLGVPTWSYVSVLKESYSWLVLDSPSYRWVTPEEESQTSSHMAIQMAKTMSPGTFCQKPSQRDAGFPQPPPASPFLYLVAASWGHAERQQLLLAEGTRRGCCQWTEASWSEQELQ